MLYLDYFQIIFKDQKDRLIIIFKKIKIKINLLVFLLALSPTNTLACGIGVSTQESRCNIRQLLCWRGQGMKGHENHADLICVEGKSHTRRKKP